MSLKLNPGAKICIQSATDSPSFLIEVPIRGVSLCSVQVAADNLPGAHEFLCSTLIDGRTDVQIDEQAETELVQIGLFAPADSLPQAVNYEFPRCCPTYSGPLLSRAEVEAISSERSPSCQLRLPTEWSEQAIRFMAHRGDGIWAPVRVDSHSGPDDRAATKRLELCLPANVSDSDATRAQFIQEGFVNLDNLLPAEHVAELGRYFQALTAEGFLPCLNDRGTHRYVAHNHTVARYWHDQLNRRVSQLARQPTKPSYCFASVYAAGGGLSWHNDRTPCEYTIALLLFYTPLRADNRSPWALKLKARDGTVHSVHQRVGDALMFKGRELMHSRDVLPDGHRSVSLMFHFVDADYAGEME